MNIEQELDVLYNHVLRLSQAHSSKGLECIEREYLGVMRGLVGEATAPVVVELGMRHGISTIALLRGAIDSGGTVNSIDFDPTCELIIPPGLPFVFRGMDSIEAAGTLDIHPDFVLVDSDHTYEYTAREIAAWWPKMNSGGHMLFHDSYEAGGVWKAIEEAGLPVAQNFFTGNHFTDCVKP